jgi:uncharacterized protein YacL (UPF0231 family)
MAEERKVQFHEGKALADRHAMAFLEVSAKTGDNIQESFVTLGREILSSIRNNEIVLQRDRLDLRKDTLEEEEGRNCTC